MKTLYTTKVTTSGGRDGKTESAIRHIGRNKKVTIPELSVECEVSLIPAPTGFALMVALHPQFTGLDQKVCEDLVSEAHKICPYSNATRGNIEVAIKVN